MQPKLLAIILISVALTSLLACQQEYDPAYDGWKRYRDQADGFEILIPHDWTADDDIVPGYRSTRFSYVQKYTGPEAAFVHISVTCQDIEAELSAEEIQAKVMALPAIAGWEEATSTLSTGTLAKEEVTTLRIVGRSHFISDNIQANVFVRQWNGKLVIVAASSTNNIFKEVADVYGKILASFRW